jgi:autotransporter-associated beta strand protein
MISEPAVSLLRRVCKITFFPIIAIIILFGTILGAPPSASAQTLMMKFGFEDTGTTTIDSVAGVVLGLTNASGVAQDYHGTTGSGVAGLGKALDFSSAGANNNANPFAGTSGNTAINFGTISGGFTVTMWVKPTGAIEFGRFFGLGASTAFDSGAAGSLAFLGNNNNTSFQADVNTTANTITTGGLSIPNNQWTFVAYVYDGSSTITFYTASQTASVGAGGLATAANAGGSVAIGSTFNMFIGNRLSSGNHTRGFPAYFDDVRFYTGASTTNFLETVRKSALPDPFVAATTIAPSNAPVGARVLISAASSGTAPITNQWFFTGTNGVTTAISGAINTSYVIQSVQTTNAGTYRLVAANSVGTTTNTGATLTVIPLAGAGVNIVDIGSADPVPQASDISQLVTNNVVTGGNAQDGLNYYADSASPPGQTFTTGSNPNGYIINGIYLHTAGRDGNSTATAQNYTLRLYSVSGSTATLISTYVTANQLGFPDGDWLLYSGGFTNVLQTNTVYAYTHHRNTSGWDLLGYNNNGSDLYPGGGMCVIPPAGGAITFGSSGIDDAAFNIGLSPTPSTPVITQQPVSQTVVVGQAVSFSVGILGGGTPTYQWFTSSDTNYSNASAISGATGIAYSISSPTLSNATNYFVVINTGVTSSVTTLTVRLSVNSLAWLGTNSFNWDLTSPNWSNTLAATSGVLYQTGDNVQFTDAGKSSSPIALTAALAPTSVSVASSSNYIFAGSGSLAGNVQLTKSGTGTLVISNANTFRGLTMVNNGILQLANASALGTVTNLVSVNGGTLDFHGIAAPTSLQYSIQGTGYTNAGALANSGGNIQNGNGVLGVTLLADATIGAVGRWDLNGDGGGTGLQGNGYNLTKVGAGSTWFIDASTNNQLANITILNGTLGFQGTNDLGDPTKTLSVLGGGLGFYAVCNNGLGVSGLGLNKSSIVLSNASFSNAGGNLTLNSPINLIGTNTQSAGYLETSSMQNSFNGPISGTGGLVINSVEQDLFNGTNTYSGPTIINSAALLTVGANSSLGSSSLIQLGNASAIIDMSSTPGLMLGSGQTLAGIGTFYGNVTNRTGSTLSPGVGGPGTLTLASGDLTLTNATVAVDLGSDPTQVGNGVNDYVSVSGNLNLSGMTTIQISPVGPLSVATYTILTYGGSLSGGSANLQVTSANPRYTYTVVDPATTPGSIKISVLGVPTPIVWKGGKSPSPNVWNHTVTNFFNTGTSAYDRFYDGDLVTFDDTSVTNIVNVTDVNAPGLLTLANNTTNYTFVGGGNLSGTLDKEGAGTVMLAISNALALNYITNNLGTLVLSPSVDSTLATVISDNGSGLGTLVKAGTNLLTLSGNNSAYYGRLSVANGTLRYTALTALGSSSSVYATNAGSLDINNIDTGSENINIAGPGFNGQGALVDLTTAWPAWPYQIVHYVTMLGDAAIGANARWDVASGSFTGNGFKLTKVLGSQVTLVNIGATGLGDIDIVGGNLTFQQNTDMGDPTKSVMVESNASLGFWAGANTYSKTNITVINATITSGGSANTLDGQVTLQPGTNYISTSVDLNLLGPVVGAGGFIKQGGGTLWLFGTNTYSGPTIIGANSTVSVGANSSLGSSSTIEIDGGSTLDVSAPASFNLGAGQTIIGNGTLMGGSIIFGSGSTLSVGFSGTTATLSAAGNLSLQFGSTNIVDVNKTTSIANDKVTGLSSVTMGGTLVINNLGNALAGGDAIPLFGATTIYSGSFASIVPSTPGTGLAWNTNTLASDGTLRVLATVNLNRTNIVTQLSGNQLTLSWPADHTGWRLQAQTNVLSVGLRTNWVDVTGANTTNQVIVPMNPANGSVFFRMVSP